MTGDQALEGEAPVALCGPLGSVARHEKAATFVRRAPGFCLARTMIAAVEISLCAVLTALPLFPHDDAQGPTLSGPVSRTAPPSGGTPEPATMLLLAGGALGYGAYRMRRRNPDDQPGA